jgi:predicted Zn-dependent peptidase
MIKNKLRKLITGIFFFVIIIGTGTAAEVSDTGEYFKKNVVERKLKNGITLIMMNRGYSPIVSLHIAFKVGSADESYNTQGAAHILEHMLFKGTDRLGTKNYVEEKKLLDKIEAIGETLDRLKLQNPGNREIAGLENELQKLQEEHSQFVISSPYDRLYTAMGGVGFNASTSTDMTGYYIDLPAERIESWAEIESERLRKPVMREYYPERNNILEERLMRYGSNGRGFINEAFYAAAYTAHPYRHPVIGWESNIKFMSINDIRRFYNDYYIPSRMTITIVGKQDTERTYAIIKKYFENIEVKPDPGEVKVIEPLQAGEKRVEVFFNARPLLMVGWKKPAAPHRDDYVFDLISSILGDGSSSRLHKALVLDKKIATSVYAWNGAPGSRYDNMFIIYASPANGIKPEQVEAEILAEISRLKNSIKPAELEKVRNMMESSFVFMLDNNDGIAHQLSYYQTVSGNWTYISDYMRNISSITTEDVAAVIDKYINDRNRTTAILRDSRSAK